MDNPVRTGRKPVCKGSRISFYKDTMKIPNGNTAEWDFIKHNGAAAVLPVKEDGKIVMVRQYRNSLDRETLEIPAGGLNSPDEPTLDAATRELTEETGYTSAHTLKKLISIATAIAFCDEVIDIYVADSLSRGEQNLDEDEYINVEEYTLDELTDMIYTGEIIDSKTVAGILAYKDSLGRTSA